MTGEKILDFNESRGQAMITAVAAGSVQARLVSGDSHGRVVIWNVLAGARLQVLEPSNTPREIVGIIHHEHMVYCAGWSKRILQFDVPDEINLDEIPKTVPENLDCQRPQAHCTDITALVKLSGTHIVTASYDGNIMVWNTRDNVHVRTFSSRDCYASVVQTRAQVSHRSSALQDVPIIPPPHHDPQNAAVDAFVVLHDRVRRSVALRRSMATTASLVVSSDCGKIYMYQPITGVLLGGARSISLKTASIWLTGVA